MLGPYRGTGGPKCQQMQASSQWKHMYNKGKQLKTSFSYMGQNVKKLYISGYLRGPGEPSMIRLGIILLSSYPLLSSNPKYFFFSYLGGPYVEPRVTKCSGQ